MATRFLADATVNDVNETFIGRRAEIEWLSERLYRRRQSAPIVVAGAGGVGKTTLLQLFLTSRRREREEETTWLNLDTSADPMGEVSAFVERLYASRDGEAIVAIDGAERLTDDQMEVVSQRVLNLKRIRGLIFSTRRAPIMPRAEILNLGAMGPQESEELLQKLLKGGFPEEMLARAVQITAGYPAAAKMLAQLVREGRRDEVAELLRGEIYDVEKALVLPAQEIISEVRPRIVVVNAALVERLRRQPESIYSLPARQFEEVIAELLEDMGFEVELTKQTRDGGKDILAYMNTGIGKFLCLVEAKKYRKDRKVGVELVRTLYGTLCDYQANSAMLVTTSSFSTDARAFQKKHQYQLSLQGYGDVVKWIQDYKRR
jgi:HJR/Mrr/RecB family endonuclease